VEELNIKKGQRWSLKNSIRPLIVIKDYDKYSGKIYWYNEDSPKMIFDFEVGYFLNNFYLVENA